MIWKTPYANQRNQRFYHYSLIYVKKAKGYKTPYKNKAFSLKIIIRFLFGKNIISHFSEIVNMFTNRKKCDIIIVPNKFHKSITGIFLSFYKRVNYTFFRHTQLSYEFGKSANSIGDCVRNILLIARNLFGDNWSLRFSVR